MIFEQISIILHDLQRFFSPFSMAFFIFFHISVAVSPKFPSENRIAPAVARHGCTAVPSAKGPGPRPHADFTTKTSWWKMGKVGMKKQQKPWFFPKKNTDMLGLVRIFRSKTLESSKQNKHVIRRFRREISSTKHGRTKVDQLQQTRDTNRNRCNGDIKQKLRFWPWTRDKKQHLGYLDNNEQVLWLGNHG